MDFDALIQSSGPYGPWVMFVLLLASGVGIPIGEEVVNIPAGFLVAKGVLDLKWVLAASYFGIIAADLCWFSISARFGTRLLHTRGVRRLFHPRRILQAKHQIEKRGAWFMVICRFIPSSRTPGITLAGMLHMPLWKFMLVEFTCVAVTAPLQILLGYLIGSGVADNDTATLVQWVIGIVVVVVVLPMIIGWLLRARANRSAAPRARARWLRKSRSRIRRRATPRPPTHGDEHA